MPPADVKTLAVNCRSQNVSTAFLIQHDNDLLLHVYTQLEQFNVYMGLPATPWDNESFLVKGELHHNQKILVRWDNTCFSRTNQLRLTSTALLDTEVANNHVLANLGPYGSDDADTEVI